MTMGTIPAQAIEASAALPEYGWWLLALALVLSSLGFYRTVYFVSLGYGLSVAGMALLSLALFRDTWTWGPVLQAALLVAYGLRLSLHLGLRELKPAYRHVVDRDPDRPARQPIRIGLLIWVSVSVLYVLMFSPAWFGLSTGWGSGPLAWVAAGGLAVMAGGLALETWADRQKSALKAAAPDQFCHTGLYRLVRCPNYLGEIVFWIGGFVAGLPAYGSWLRWVMAAVGLVCIVLIMIGSAKRLERSQQQRYGHREDYLDYTRTVPILVPFVPLYSLRNVRVYLE